MSLIKIEHVSKTYSNGETETPVLEDVNFEIQKGEFVAIMGPSGSGKSTLLNILGFLDGYTSGTYLFEDRPAHEYSSDAQARIRNQKMGFVFQSFQLLPRMTVKENVMLPLLYSDVPEAEWALRAETALESVGLSHRLDFFPPQLSGGEKQRVAIARSLVVNPSVIFADEPTGNLDSKSGQKVMSILQNLHSKFGHTILLITHEKTTAENAQRIIRIRDGHIESDEKVSERRFADGGYEK
ncbi:MAG: hypothetical protein A3B90_00945 [Candidatus Magasanikbacteria bacterium RIFCSPHIGHO2_02_FULL_41_13]|uniref:ABC transporter domain-containing protein n=1 Tax=Candidatus Magasanikbacteria bacterium RIFCSPHIGHO2_02_FULL_41_13 TaxID=1798676 RepID=A0A1F6M4Q0_9BACT|nr:MAG: hypothetical protein A3B90_00945 [Candidatus Magasanikbacteria bacterium RIFCSPHIGHO2_02_FULL_41_13]